MENCSNSRKRIATQEQLRLEISEILKDCSEDKFFTILQIAFGKTEVAFLSEKDEKGFQKIVVYDL